MSLLDSENMPHRVTHLRRTHDRGAGQIATLHSTTTVASGLAAWIQNASMAEINEFAKRDMRITNRVNLNADPNAQPGDYFSVTSGPSMVGDMLKLQAIEDRTAGLGKMFTAWCELDR